MQNKFFISVEEKEKIFCTELVKYGVEYEKAAKAAKILASLQPDEFLTQEDIQIVKEACNQWAKQHKRYKRLKSLVNNLV